MNSGMSGRYARPMQLFQQLDFSAVPVSSSYNDLANLTDVTNAPQSNSVHHHIAPPADNSSISTSRPLTGEYSSGRPAADFCMPSLPTFTDANLVPGFAGNFNQHFQHFPNQMLFAESSYHATANAKVSNFSKPWCSSSQLSDGGHPPDEATAVESFVQQPKPRKGRKPSADKKKKKEKVKRVRYIKPGCSDMCRRRCKQKISQSMREDLFNKYWNLDDEAKKKDFIAQNAIKMPMMKCKEGSRRSFSVDWAFTINGESYSVCKLFFLHTLDVPENTAYAAIKDTEFFHSGTPIIKGKASEKSKIKPTWFETDLDDYSHLEKKGKYSRDARYGSFTKKERFSEMRPGCSKLCRKHCQFRFTYEERSAIFNEYRGLSNIRKEREYISRYIHRMERKRVRAGESTRRGCSIQWTLPLRNQLIPVCKTFFLHTVGISERAAYNIGLTNEIQPVEKPIKRPRKNIPTQTLSGKVKSFGSIIAKGKLKSALKRSRKGKKRADEDDEDEYYFDAWKDNNKKGKRKNSKQRGRKRKRTYDKTVRFKKIKVENSIESEEDSDGESWEMGKKGASAIKISSSLFRLPIKKRENLKHKVPILKIKGGKVISLTGKRRNPYKRKNKPTKNSYTLCPENCKKNCRQNLSEEARKEIFDDFWKLDNMEEQRKFISRCVKKIAKPTCACLVASHVRGKRRGYSISWNLMFRGLEVPVCKTFFMHVLQVSDSIVYKAVREDEGFIADSVVLPCKHFTGRNQVPYPLTTDCHGKPTKAEIAGPSDASSEGMAASRSSDKESGMLHSNEPSVYTSDMSKRNENIPENDVAESVAHSKLIAGSESNIRNSASIIINNDNVGMAAGGRKVPASIQNAQNSEKLNPPLQSATADNLCNIEANYEALIPSLNNDHSQESGHILPPPQFPNELMPPYAQAEKSKNTPGVTLPSLPSNCGQPEPWPKPMDTFHPMFNSSHPMFPALADTRVEPVHNIPHPRNLSAHFAFQQSSNHHSHFPAQPAPPGHHTPSFSQLHPDLSSSHMAHAGHVGFDSDLMGNFYHSSRYHNFGASINMSRECAPNSSEYSMDSDHQVYHNSLLMQTLKKTNNDVLLQNQNRPPKPKRKKKKPNTPPKPKLEKVKEPRPRKGREKKPFTRYVKAGCSDSCKRKCTQKIPQHAREELFQEFWSLENDTRRREFVLPIVNKVPKKTCSGVNSRRCCTIEWSMPYEGELHVVCKRFFLDTFDLGEKFVKTVFDKVEHRGGSMEDLRGRHCKRSSVFVKEQEQIENHIRSVSTLKAFQCASCKKDFTRWCLDSGVVVSQLYKLYADGRRMEGKKPACRSTYTDICTKKFNLKNSMAHENLCDQCAKSSDTHHDLPSGSSAAYTDSSVNLLS